MNAPAFLQATVVPPSPSFSLAKTSEKRDSDRGRSIDNVDEEVRRLVRRGQWDFRANKLATSTSKPSHRLSIEPQVAVPHYLNIHPRASTWKLDRIRLNESEETYSVALSVFCALDSDSNGFLTVGHLERLAKMYWRRRFGGQAPTNAELDELLDRFLLVMDTDANGNISYHKFKVWYVAFVDQVEDAESEGNIIPGENDATAPISGAINDEKSPTKVEFSQSSDAEKATGDNDEKTDLNIDAVVEEETQGQKDESIQLQAFSRMVTATMRWRKRSRRLSSKESQQQSSKQRVIQDVELRPLEEHYAPSSDLEELPPLSPRSSRRMMLLRSEDISGIEARASAYQSSSFANARPLSFKHTVPIPRELDRLPNGWKRDYVSKAGHHSVFEYWRKNNTK